MPIPFVDNILLVQTDVLLDFLQIIRWNSCLIMFHNDFIIPYPELSAALRRLSLTHMNMGRFIVLI